MCIMTVEKEIHSKLAIYKSAVYTLLINQISKLSLKLLRLSGAEQHLTYTIEEKYCGKDIFKCKVTLLLSSKECYTFLLFSFSNVWIKHTKKPGRRNLAFPISEVHHFSVPSFSPFFCILIPLSPLQQDEGAVFFVSTIPVFFCLINVFNLKFMLSWQSMLASYKLCIKIIYLSMRKFVYDCCVSY